MVGNNDLSDNVTFAALWINASLGGAGSDELSGNGSEDLVNAGKATAAANVIGSVLVGTVLSVVVICTVVGNVMVLLAVFVNSHLRSTTNYFIVNLAIADLLLGTTVLPFSASLEVLKKWMFGQVFCDIWAAIDVLCCTASIFSLCVISIDRYIGVTRPLQRSTIMTEKRALYVIIFIWLLSITISIAPLVGWKEPASSDPYECTVTTQTGYVVFSVSASFYIPLSIILLVYFRIYREAIKHSRFLTTGVKTTKVDESGITLRVHKGGNSHVHFGPGQSSPHYNNSKSTSPGHQSSSSSERSESSVGNKIPSRLTTAGKVARFKRETKAAKTLGIVVGVFILCWFPFFFILPLGSLCHHCNIPPLLFDVFFWLGYCNSLMNPIIYACSSREFQFAFRRILRCQFRRRPRVFLTDQESSSCHEFNQLEHCSGRAQRSSRKSERKRTKSRKDKFIRTFKSSKLSTRNQSSANHHTPPVDMHSFNVATSDNDLRVTESPTESLRSLQRKLGAQMDIINSVNTLENSQWKSSNGSVAGLRRESISNEDLFEDFAGESLYSNCGAR